MPLRLHQGLVVPEGPLDEFDRAWIEKRIAVLKDVIAQRGVGEQLLRWLTDRDDFEKTQLAIYEGTLDDINRRNAWTSKQR